MKTKLNVIAVGMLLAATGTGLGQSTLRFGASSYTVAENAGPATLTVWRLNDTSGVVTVDYATANGTATAGLDYTATNGTLTFAVGETNQNITVPILNDGLVEAAIEVFTVALSNATGGAVLGTPTTTTVRITENDTGLQTELATWSTREGEAFVQLGVVRGADDNFPVTVDFATSNLTATAGLDYTATNGTLSFAAGEKLKLFAVPILNDGLKESSETFRVTLMNPTNQVLGTRRTTTVTIADNDLGVLFEPNTYWVAENEGTLALKVVRGNDVNLGPFTLDFATSDVTATNGLDYVGTNGTLSFTEGEMAKTLTVPILYDEVPEADEQFRVTLSNLTGDAALSSQYFRATVTIEEAVSALVADPRVARMVEAVEPTDLLGALRQITGEEALLVGGEAYVLTNRFTTSNTIAPIWKATQFVHDQLRSLGLEVQDQRWDGLFQIPAGSCWYTNVNVIGTQPGQSRSNEFVLITAHLDDIVPPYVNLPIDARAAGADDNASGVVAVLAAARSLSQYRFDRTVQFILFTGEEGFMLGSSNYAAQARAEGRNITAVLNLDMIGWEPALPPRCSLFTRSGPSSSYPDFPLAYAFMYVVRTYGLEDSLWPVRSYANYGSDHKSFWNQGYAAMAVGEYSHDSYPCYHTPEDTLLRLNLPYLSAVVRAAVGTVAHLAGVVGERPVGILEVANSDWTPGSGIGGGCFYAKHETEASETAGDPRDIAWADTPPNPNGRWLRLHTAPHGVELQTDARPSGSETIFQAKLAVGDATGTGVSCSNRLRFSFRTPPASDRIYLARIHVDGRYVEGGADFDCVTDLRTVAAGGGFVDLPALHQVPDGAVYGTCDIAARFWNTNSSSCRLRLASVSDQSVVLMATAQLGSHFVDALEVNTNLASSAEWTLVKSYTNSVSPEAAHFDVGWTEIAREVDPALLPASEAHFFRLKRTWLSP